MLCYCEPTKGILPADQEAIEAIKSLEQSSITFNDQDGTCELNQSYQPPLPPKTYQEMIHTIIDWLVD